MFKKKNYDTPADEHIRSLAGKVRSARDIIKGRANRITRLMKVYEILPACPEKTSLKDRIDKVKKELLSDFEEYNKAKTNYERYCANTKDSRVTTISYVDEFPDVIELLYALM